MLVGNFIERLRPLVGSKGWSYIVLWKLSNDHRSIEWMGCCCAGTENMGNGGEELDFNASCRDVMFPHPRIISCDLLDQLPSSIELDSGVYEQTILSNQACWLNFSDNSDSSLLQETIGTRVLIPFSLGLLELFVTKQVPEDQQVIDFIQAQCNTFLEPQAMNHLQQFNITSAEPEHTNNTGIFLEGTTAYESNNIFIPSIENGFHHDHQAMEMSQGNIRWMQEPLGTIDQMNDDSLMCEHNRGGSDESDPNDDEDDSKYRRRTGKGQSKNLMAERKRRKKLNDRLYSLRALVPKISKLDRASILGDAIDYVKELQKQVEDLKIELEEQSDDDDDGVTRGTGRNDIDNGIPPSIIHQNGTRSGAYKHEHENSIDGFHKESSGNNNSNIAGLKKELDNTTDEKVQQMEPQVEVFQLDGNEFFVKVFCEHKSGGFVRLMEALNSLGFDVTNVNTTRHTCLVTSIFKVERKNDDNVEADQVKESLLELTRNPSRVWPNVVEGSQTASIIDDDYNIHHHLVHSQQMNPHHHLQHLHH